MIAAITGRKQDALDLQRRIISNESELIVVYGRRRVGKTSLVREVSGEFLSLEFAGIRGASMKQQLRNFREALQETLQSRLPVAVPGDWFEAFQMLGDQLSVLSKVKPLVLFFDEFPLIHTPKSSFLQAFDHWWNSFASRRKNIKVIISGSNSSWITQNIMSNKGGLQSRVTFSLRVKPFSLYETEEFLNTRQIKLSRQQLLELYMCTGGIPYYLRGIQAGETVAEAIDRLCFSKDGILRGEFKNLCLSLFENSYQHEQIIKALFKKSKGLTRNEILSECKISTGGTITKVLIELEEAGFISVYVPYLKSTKDAIYRLSDEYIIFYLKFVEQSRISGPGTWIRHRSSTNFRTWSETAFEVVSQKHRDQIKYALGISGVHVEYFCWRNTGRKADVPEQFDLVISRADRSINLCEFKFSNDRIVLDRKNASDIDRKQKTFREKTKNKKVLFLTLISPWGVSISDATLTQFEVQITLNQLFS